MAVPRQYPRPDSFARRPLTRDEAEVIARTLKAIADPTRLQLLSMLNGSADKEANVSDMAERLGLRAPTISHHLKIMLEDGLLDRDQRGRQVWYSIRPERQASITDLLR